MICSAQVHRESFFARSRIVRRVVVFPAPLIPIKPVMQPSDKENETSVSEKFLYDLFKFFTLKISFIVNPPRKEYPSWHSVLL